MIHQLKVSVENKCGFSIKNRGDCVRLTSLIMLETGIDLSYNTLRRFFNLVKSTKPHKSTLDILSKYTGYESYVNFCSVYPEKKSWDAYQKVYEKIVKNPIKALKLIEEGFENPADYNQLLITLIGGLTVMKRLEILKKVFDSELLNPERFNYSEILYFGNCVGPMFRQMRINISLLLSTKYFTPIVFNSFIDISSLNGNYGNFTKKINTITTDKEQHLFTSCILELRSFLNTKKIKKVITSLKIDEIHPILYGRYAGIAILDSNESNKPDKALQFLNQISERENKIDYLYEFIFACILGREVGILKLIEKKMMNYKISKPYYQEYHYSLFELRDAILLLESGQNIDKEIDHLKEKTMFRNSHRDFIEVFISILEYHNSGKNEAKHKNYTNLSQKVNYPIFDKAYCFNYFDS